MSREIDVQILGKAFTFQVADEVSHDEFLIMIDYVESKLKKIKDRLNELDTFKLGLLTAINIAQDYMLIKKEHDHLRAILQKIDGLVTNDRTEHDTPTVC
jgi:cell division protein ZapA